VRRKTFGGGVGGNSDDRSIVEEAENKEKKKKKKEEKEKEKDKGKEKDVGDDFLTSCFGHVFSKIKLERFKAFAFLMFALDASIAFERGLGASRFSRWLRPLYATVWSSELRRWATLILRTVPEIWELLVLLVTTIGVFSVIGILLFSKVSAIETSRERSEPLSVTFVRHTNHTTPNHTAQHSTTQHNTAQHSTTQHNTTQHNTTNSTNPI